MGYIFIFYDVSEKCPSPGAVVKLKSNTMKNLMGVRIYTMGCHAMKNNLLTFEPKSKTKLISVILAENYGIHTPVS